LQVRPDAPHNASQRAAAIQAASAILLNLYPAQNGTLTTRRNASLAALALTEHANSIAAGVAWGQTVADAIWASRLTDGFAPTPPPLALSSEEYAADLNEVKTMGSFSNSMRTSDQSELALFWALNTPLAWNRIAAQISAERWLTLAENAHLFAVLNLALSDALIACWDSKYRYVFWRPITAIRTGLTPADADPLWEPWLDSTTGTPAHSEYPSAHSSMSGAAAFVLAAAFGENTAFTVTSEVRSGTRAFSSFSDAIAEIVDARVFGGIYFRTSCVRANTLGRAVADYVSGHAMRERDDDRDDD
jgi:hypothetical protein